MLEGPCRLYARLHLKVNEAKTAVAPASRRKFLAYALWHGKGRQVKYAVAGKALANFKQRTRDPTRRSCGRSDSQVTLAKKTNR
ncbi:hypothetical protein HDG37_007249 [Paraburkholderia sp. MM5384-R2]|nr:hypothetical protein [Paraburkholderia sp. MM5384-R2]